MKTLITFLVLYSSGHVIAGGDKSVQVIFVDTSTGDAIVVAGAVKGVEELPAPDTKDKNPGDWTSIYEFSAVVNGKQLVEWLKTKLGIPTLVVAMSFGEYLPSAMQDTGCFWEFKDMVSSDSLTPRSTEFASLVFRFRLKSKLEYRVTFSNAILVPKNNVRAIGLYDSISGIINVYELLDPIPPLTGALTPIMKKDLSSAYKKGDKVFVTLLTPVEGREVNVEEEWEIKGVLSDGISEVIRIGRKLDTLDLSKTKFVDISTCNFQWGNKN